VATDGPESPFRLSARDVFAAIEGLRNENREARHAQANSMQRVIGELDDRIDTRLRALEVTIAAALPATLGPRINELEREMARLDGDTPGGAPKRLNDLEARWDKVEGGVLALKAAVGILVVINTILGIVVAILALT
jgi:hypothetical protein